ncbi:MAG TPA: hypothetical protein PKW95_23170 [bacterium]|nr:hypothetical protein [bacterium]
MTQTSLVVRFDTPTSDFAFLAAPFSPSFNKICAAVERAVGYENLGIKRTDKTPKTQSFINDYKQLIYQSKIVIAICSPISKFGKLNPNVMYELGWAQSIGKATLVMTNNKKAIPSDLGDQSIFPYSNSDLRKDHFINEIRTQIRTVLDRVKNNISDSERKDISLATKILSRSGLYKPFITIFGFGKRLHSQFLEIEIAHFDQLRLYSLELAYNHENANQQRVLVDFQTAWNRFKLEYYKDFGALLSADFSQYSHVFKTLVGKVPVQMSDSLEKAHQYYAQVTGHLATFEQNRNAVSSCMDKILREPITDGLSVELWQYFNDLYATTKVIEVHVEGLMVNLMDCLKTLAEET